MDLSLYSSHRSRYKLRVASGRVVHHIACGKHSLAYRNRHMALSWIQNASLRSPLWRGMEWGINFACPDGCTHSSLCYFTRNDVRINSTHWSRGQWCNYTGTWFVTLTAGIGQLCSGTAVLETQRWCWFKCTEWVAEHESITRCFVGWWGSGHVVSEATRKRLLCSNITCHSAVLIRFIRPHCVRVAFPCLHPRSWTAPKRGYRSE